MGIQRMFDPIDVGTFTRYSEFAEQFLKLLSCQYGFFNKTYARHRRGWPEPLLRLLRLRRPATEFFACRRSLILAACVKRDLPAPELWIRELEEEGETRLMAAYHRAGDRLHRTKVATAPVRIVACLAPSRLRSEEISGQEALFIAS